MVPILDEIHLARYGTVVGVMGSQMGKTDSMLNGIGCRLQDDPVPILYVAPTKDFVTDTWEPRFQAMVKGVGALWKRLRKGKAEKKTLKRISGVSVRFAWAGSPTQLAGEAACKVYVDERDRMKADVGGEGDPKRLADNRHATYADGQTIVFSTPLTGNVETYVDEASGLEFFAVSEHVESPTWKLWQQGTRYQWAWPCPHCRDYFIPYFKLLWWPEKADPYVALTEARMVCPRCGSQIEEADKEKMNANGRYVAPGQKITKEGEVLGKPPASDTVSFWVSGLCSPWKSFGQRAYDWLEAVRSGVPEDIQAVINTGFGELYSVKGEAPKKSAVEALRLPYKFGDHVAGVQRVTMACDVQENRIYYVVRGWGAEMESWLLQHGVIYVPEGQTTKDDWVWNELQKFRDKLYCGKAIERQFVDSGYITSTVYRYCRKHLGWAIPTKGRDTMDAPLAKTFVDTSPSGKRMKGGLAVWIINTDYFKRWIHERLERDPELPGGFHLSEDTNEDYCLQLVSEARVVKPSGHVVWVMIRPDNHYFDCEALNLAAAHSLHLQMLTRTAVQEQASGAATPAGEGQDKSGVDPFEQGGDEGFMGSLRRRDT